MGKMTDNHKQRIVSALEQRGVTAPCPRCGHKSFALVDGYFAAVVQSSLPSLQLGGQLVPYIAVVCSHCGFMAQHSLGALGLMDLITDDANLDDEV